MRPSFPLPPGHRRRCMWKRTCSRLRCRWSPLAAWRSSSPRRRTRGKWPLNPCFPVVWFLDFCSYLIGRVWSCDPPATRQAGKCSLCSREQRLGMGFRQWGLTCRGAGNASVLRLFLIMIFSSFSPFRPCS